MENESNTLKEIKNLLTAMLMILVRNNFSDENKKLSIGEAARFLHSAGIQPSEIAILLGKKKSSEISAHLYTKKK